MDRFLTRLRPTALACLVLLLVGSDVGVAGLTNVVESPGLRHTVVPRRDDAWTHKRFLRTKTAMLRVVDSGDVAAVRPRLSDVMRVGCPGDCLNQAADVVLAKLRQEPDGGAGWLRRLGRALRFGTVRVDEAFYAPYTAAYELVYARLQVQEIAVADVVTGRKVALRAIGPLQCCPSCRFGSCSTVSSSGPSGEPIPDVRAG